MEYEYINDYEYGCMKKKGGYLSYHAAFAFLGHYTQCFNWIYISYPKRFNPFEHCNVRYVRVPDKHREGIVKHETLNVYYTELERTIIDCIDMQGLAGGYEELYCCMEDIGDIDETKLLYYLSKYNKPILYHRAGYFLSLFREQMKLSDSFFEVCQEKKGTRKRYLTPYKNECETYIPEWRLYVPKYLLALASPYRMW